MAIDKEKVSKFKKDSEMKEIIENSFKHEAKLTDIITVKPEVELATMGYYKNIPGVEVTSEVSEFWNTQQSKIANIQHNIERPTMSYLNAYNSMQYNMERLEKSRERMMGSNDPNKQIQKLEEQKREIIKNEVKQVKNRVNPGMLLLEKFTGFSTEESRKLKDPYKHLQQIKQSIKAAKERRDDLLKSQNELEAEIEINRIQMLDSLQQVDNEKCKASIVNDNSKKIQSKLQEQYRIIDMYQSIQKFKNSPNYVATKNILKIRSPELARDIESLPENIPSRLLKISISNPLDLSNLPVNSDRLAELSSKIDEIKTRLPNGLNVSNPKDAIDNYKRISTEEVDKYKAKATEETNTLKLEQQKEMTENKIKDTDTVQSLKKELDDLSKSSMSSEDKTKKQEQLQMKIEHLEIKEQVKAAQDELVQIQQYMVDEPLYADQWLPELNAQKARLEILQNKLANDKYSLTISDIETKHNKQLSDLSEKHNKELSDLKDKHNKDLLDLKEKHSQVFSDLSELQNLVNEQKALQIPENVSKILEISDRLEQSPIMINGSSISLIYLNLRSEFSKQKREAIEAKLPDKEKDNNEKVGNLPVGAFKKIKNNDEAER